MCEARSGAAAATAADGTIVVVGGTDGYVQHASIERLCARPLSVCCSCC
jgi:hypothetical protein